MGCKAPGKWLLPQPSFGAIVREGVNCFMT